MEEYNKPDEKFFTQAREMKLQGKTQLEIQARLLEQGIEQGQINEILFEIDDDQEVKRPSLGSPSRYFLMGVIFFILALMRASDGGIFFVLTVIICLVNIGYGIYIASRQ